MNNKINWISELNVILNSAEAKIDGKKVNLGIALDIFEKFFVEVKEKKSNVWWVGNGGSSAICSHLSQDVLNKLGIKSFCFSDASLVTCMANDFGYEDVYSKPLTVYLQKNDLLIAISSSGESKNILNCVDYAKKNNINVITLSAFDKNNQLWNRDAALSLFLECDLYGHAEIGHAALCHAVIEVLWKKNIEDFN